MTLFSSYLSLKNTHSLLSVYALVEVINEDKTYGVEKSAIFKYKMANDKLHVAAYDLNNKKIFDIEVDIKSQTGTITNVYIEDKVQTRINGCNAAIYAAGAPWTIGFGMLNPLAGLAAATFFWALEHAVCSEMKAEVLNPKVHY